MYQEKRSPRPEPSSSFACACRNACCSADTRDHDRFATGTNHYSLLALTRSVSVQAARVDEVQLVQSLQGERDRRIIYLSNAISLMDFSPSVDELLRLCTVKKA